MYASVHVRVCQSSALSLGRVNCSLSIQTPCGPVPQSPGPVDSPAIWPFPAYAESPASSQSGTRSSSASSSHTRQICSVNNHDDGDCDPLQPDHRDHSMGGPPAGRPLNRAPEALRQSVVNADPFSLEGWAHALYMRLFMGTRTVYAPESLAHICTRNTRGISPAPTRGAVLCPETPRQSIEAPGVCRGSRHPHHCFP